MICIKHIFLGILEFVLIEILAKILASPNLQIDQEVALSSQGTSHTPIRLSFGSKQFVMRKNWVKICAPIFKEVKHLATILHGEAQCT